MQDNHTRTIMDITERFTKIHFTSITPQTPAENAPESKGRSGQIKTTGVEIYTNPDQALVCLSPITSQACYLQIPLEKQALLALAAKLTRLAELAPEPATA
jgi:hypothetical protein